MDMQAGIGPARTRETGRVKASRATNWALVALFLGLLCVPGVTQIATLSAPAVADRVLAPPPQWMGFSRLRDLAKATDAYIEDHFGLRRQLVRWNSLVRYRLGVSSTPQVVIGKDDWLFYAYAPEKIMEQHTGANVFTPAELERWVAAMTANRDWLARRGIAFYVLIAPDKSTIYPEKLPTYARPRERTTRADQLVARLKRTDLVLIDPRHALMDAKASTRPYSEGDSHWTEAGAYVAYRQLMERVRDTFPSVRPAAPEDYAIAPGRGPNDQAFLLGLGDDLTYTVERWTRRATHQIRTTTRTPAPGDPWGWPVRFVETDLKDQPRALIFGDSFTDYVLGPTFLYETFRDPVITHHNGGAFDFRLVEEAKPDLVIVQFAERYLASPPQPPVGF
jgi:alginate O-acetyltransferase complex protein AlgJ